MIYLNVQGRLDDAIAQVEPNGRIARSCSPNTPLDPMAKKQVIRDSEGNRVALHSM